MVEPLSGTIAITPNIVYRKLIASWIVSLVVASPLLYAYQTPTYHSGTVFCTNNTFGDLGRQIYYSIHAIWFFLVPLIYMIYGQSKIYLTLRSSVLPVQNTFTTAWPLNGISRAAKPLLALTVAFATCWSPFICVRTLMYFHLTDDEDI